LDRVSEFAKDSLAPSDPAQVKLFERDILSNSINPLSSFEISLYAKHKYRIRTRDFSDCNTFMKIELIARTLRE
jgi:hypothetical protein